MKKKVLIIRASIVVAIIVLVVLPLNFLVIQGGWTTSHGGLLCQYIEYTPGYSGYYYGEGGTEKGWELRILGIRVAGNVDKPNFKDPHKIVLSSKNEITKIEITDENDILIGYSYEEEAINTIYNILKELKTQKMAVWDYLFASEERYTLTLIGDNDMKVYIYKGYKDKKGNNVFDFAQNANEAYFAMTNDSSHAVYELTKEEFNKIIENAKKETPIQSIAGNLEEGIDYEIDTTYNGQTFVDERGYYIDSLNEPNAPYYYIICMGLKNTGGYNIKVKEVNKIDDLTEIIVEETSPSSTDAVSQAITFPKVVVKFPEYQENIKIKNTNDEEFIELNSTNDNDKSKLVIGLFPFSLTTQAKIFISNVENTRDAASNKYMSDMLTVVNRKETCYTVAELVKKSYLNVDDNSYYGAVCVNEGTGGLQ